LLNKKAKNVTTVAPDIVTYPNPKT